MVYSAVVGGSLNCSCQSGYTKEESARARGVRVLARQRREGIGQGELGF